MKLKAKTKSYKGFKGNSLLTFLLKGTLVSLCISLILVLVFAFLLKFTNIPDTAILPVNQVIKGVSIFLGVFIGMRKSREMGLICGLLIGICFTILAFLIFSLLSGNFAVDLTLFIDMIFGAVIGAICGIISVNIKKSSN